MKRSTNVAEGWKQIVWFALAIAISFGAATCQADEATAERGVLKGRFVYDGKPPKPEPVDVTKEPICKQFNLVNESLLVDANGGLKNVLVYVISKDAAPPPAKEKPPSNQEKPKVATLKIKNCRFEPHVLPMLVSQTVEIEREDEVEHHVWFFDFDNKHVGPIFAPGGEKSHKYRIETRYPVPVECNTHPWMKGYVLPRDNPYFAVSKEDGSFEIQDLPAGKALEFQVWHEKAGNFKRLERSGWTKGVFTTTIEPGEHDLGLIKFDPKLFEPIPARREDAK